MGNAVIEACNPSFWGWSYKKWGQPVVGFKAEIMAFK
jgi:hypothetical protein